MVTVYVWRFRGSGEAWGHASLRVVGGAPAGIAYVSWWPAVSPRTPKYPSAPSPLNQIYSAPAIQRRRLEDDIRDEGMKPDYQILIHGLDEAAIKTWWAGFHTGANRWKTLSQNCSTTVGQALKAGGGDKYAKGFTGWWDSWNCIWTPSDVLRFAQAISHGTP